MDRGTWQPARFDVPPPHSARHAMGICDKSFQKPSHAITSHSSGLSRSGEALGVARSVINVAPALQ
jgi:hypothetical protein